MISRWTGTGKGFPGRENGMRKDGGYEIRQGIRKYKSLGIMEIWVQVRKRIGDELEE